MSASIDAGVKCRAYRGLEAGKRSALRWWQVCQSLCHLATCSFILREVPTRVFSTVAETVEIVRTIIGSGLQTSQDLFWPLLMALWNDFCLTLAESDVHSSVFSTYQGEMLKLVMLAQT
jgi:hypothetical protein